MTLRRAAPGAQLSTGRLRVDAGRAIAKLREYQLTDRSAWVLEAIRAAVAAGATRIDLRGDANDVWLSWHGEPLPDELLPKLFDELVSPEPMSERHHVRLLAAGVNSALGMSPAYVDVTAIHAGAARRVRYTPEILLEPETELGESALRHVAIESAARPEGAPPGMVVHMRRRLTDWRVFSEPPELGLAREACRDIAVPLHVDGELFHRDTARELLRIPLGEGLDGFIAITEPERAGTSAILEVAERGVVLAEYSLELVERADRAPVPIRVFIDAPRMPTNASRSQVRRDTHPIAGAEKRAHELMPELIAALAAAVQHGSEPARVAALALLASVAGGRRWHADVPSIRDDLRPLAQLPLVKNAVGQPRALTLTWRPLVHSGKRPFGVELAAWLDSVLWLPPGEPARVLLGDAEIDARDTRRYARWARKQLRAQLRFYAHRQRELRVQTDIEPFIRAPLGCAVEASAVADDGFADLRGEVCIYGGSGAGALVVLLQGRELERVEFDSPLAFDVVIDSAKVTPAERYSGVKRDAEYARIERAMRSGLVRALEQHCAAGQRWLVGDDSVREARLLRKGFGVLSELGAAVRGPLRTAPLYRTTAGTFVSLDELAKQKVIGVIPPGQTMTAPRGRLVVELDVAERATLKQLVKGQVVPYRGDTSWQPGDARALAKRLLDAGEGALVIREDGLVAALTPASVPELQIRHVGVELDRRNYRSRWMPCTIAIDCDDVVPDASWTVAADHAGLDRRNYGAWELEAARAIALAIAGELAPGLELTRIARLEGKLGNALCEAINKHDSVELLGADVIAKLRAAHIVRVLGSDRLRSMNELAAEVSGGIPYVSEAAEPIAGYAPIVATPRIANALCKLVERDAIDGMPTLEQRRRLARRELWLTAHRCLPKQPLTVPAEDHVSIASARWHGVVGISTEPFTIRVFVEGRPFTELHPSDRDLPLCAAVDIAVADVNEAFDAVTPEVARSIMLDVRAAAPALLVDIAKRKPHLLGDEGPVRTLLATVAITGEATKKALLAAPAFKTIQGGRVALANAAEPRLILTVAAWQGEWLGHDSDPPDAYDEPIVYVPDLEHELSRIIDKLHGSAVADVTQEVGRLQARRRMARGLIPQPRVRGVARELKRPLSAMGPLAAKLGHGELGLVEDNQSSLLVHVDGSLSRVDKLDVMPSIELALEDPDPHQVGVGAQQLAVELVRQVVTAIDPAQLPAGIQRNLFRAALARRLPPVLVERLKLWRDFTAQHELLGDVWVVSEPTDAKPLDARRAVFYFDRKVLAIARGHGWNVVEAEQELALDAVARTNMSRRAARALELPSKTGVLAEELLGGDGTTSPRGIVAVLAPASAQWRALSPHRAMHPFDRVNDPCRWPTLAVIDDARITPDRTWQAPVTNDDWQAILKEVRAASERALAKIGEVPEHALAHVRITAQACVEVGALRKAPKSLIRGVLWLTGTPLERVAVQVFDRDGVRSFAPPEPLAIGGKLFIHAPDDLDADLALRQLCNQTHGKLVRALAKDEVVDRDLVAAHVAQAINVRTLRPTDVRGIEFACFSPRPLDARALASLLRRQDPVVVMRAGAAPNPDPDVIEVIDDGGDLAATVIAALGDRVRRARPTPKPRPAAESPRPPPARPPKQAPPPPKARTKEPPHVLAMVVSKLRSRLGQLGIAGYEWGIVDRAEPMFGFDSVIEVAGDNVRLRALAAALAANSPFAEAGVDVVVAHLVTVLNRALSHVTDATEADAIARLLSPPSADRPRSRRSS